MRTLLGLLALSAPLVAALAVGTSGCRPSESQSAVATWTPPDLPDTPAGRQARAFFDVLGGGDEVALRAFVAGYFSPVGPGGADLDERADAQVRLAQSSHGFDAYEVVDSKPDAVSVVGRLRLTQEWRRMTIIVEPGPPHRVLGVMIVPADPPAEAGPPLTVGALREAADAYVRRLASADEFSGVVVVARGGETLFEGTYGTADRERGVPVGLDTRFDYASVGKTFTAVAVAQLVEDGRLRYSATVADVLPELASSPAAGVTLDQLLTHRSGLVDLFEHLDRVRAVAESAEMQGDYLPLFVDAPLRFAPGERFEYSNSNYVLLGAVVERVSGQPFGGYLREHVFGPAEMTQTALSDADVPEDALARPYTRAEADGHLGTGPRHLSTVFDGIVGGAAGGGVTTARDLVRFARALRQHVLLGPEATAALLSPRVEADRPGSRYGYGVYVRDAGGERVVGHSGGAPGVDAQLDVYLNSGTTVVVLSNYEGVGEPVTRFFQTLLRRP